MIVLCEYDFVNPNTERPDYSLLEMDLFSTQEYERGWDDYHDDYDPEAYF